MTDTDERCPPPERCIDDFLRDIELFAPAQPDAAVQELADWLRGLRGDVETLGVLDRARREGADVPRLLLAAAIYRANRACLEGPLANLRITLPGGAKAPVHDINRMLDQAEETERALGRPSADAAELRGIRATLTALDEEVHRNAGQPRPYLVPDGRGGWVQRRCVPTGAAVMVTTGEIGPAHGKLGRGRGEHGDHALGVVIALVMGHLQATARCTNAKFVADLVLCGLRIGTAGSGGGASDAAEAIRRHVYRCRSKEQPEVWTRAQIVAGMLRLRFEPV